MSVSILITDDHDVVRRGVKSLLQTRPDWEVCGEAADGRTAVELSKKLKPQIVTCRTHLQHSLYLANFDW
jgi:DNA-binding NarL/FixJ family response regulator